MNTYFIAKQGKKKTLFQFESSAEYNHYFPLKYQLKEKENCRIFPHFHSTQQNVKRKKHKPKLASISSKERVTLFPINTTLAEANRQINKTHNKYTTDRFITVINPNLEFFFNFY